MSVLLSPRRRGQTFVFFLVAFGTVFLLCGLGIDSSLIYLESARLSRACDAAVISGVQNFSRSRDDVSQIMRNVAIANYPDLGTVRTLAETSSVTNASGGTNYIYSYSDSGRTTNCTTEVLNIIATGDRGQVTRASCTGKVPHQTAFMGYTGIAALKTYNLNSTAKAVRRPRLISLVLDRSGSMVSNGGSGALPDAVMTFLGLFDTNSDSIGIDSYSAWARLEVAHTNDFYWQGSNKMYYADGTSGNGSQTTQHPQGMKFNGNTAGAEGIRMGFEAMRTNVGYFSEQYQKFIVFFTDGQFNSSRSFYASPSFTNIVFVPNGTNDFDYNYTTQMPFSGNNWVVNTTKRTDSKDVDITTVRGGSRYNRTYTDYYNGILDVWLMPGSVLYEYDNVTSSNLDNLTNRPVAMWPSLWTNALIRIPLTDDNKGHAFVQVFPGYYIDGVSKGNNMGSTGYNLNNTWPQGDLTGQTSSASSSPFYQMAQRLDNNLTGSKWMIFNAEDNDWNRDGVYGDPEVYTSSSFSGNHYPRGHFIYFVQQMKRSSEGSTNLTDLVPRKVGEGARLFHSKNGVMKTYAQWTAGAPSWLTHEFQDVVMLDADTVQGDHAVLRAKTYNGYEIEFPVGSGVGGGGYGGSMKDYVTNVVRDYRYGYATGIINPAVLEEIRKANATNYTGGWIVATNLDYTAPMTADDRPFNLQANSMAYSSRPLYIFDFKTNAAWYKHNSENAPGGGNLSEFQAEAVANMAREEDVTIYTVNFSSGTPNVMENMANDKDANTFNPSQPEGEYHYVQNSSEIVQVFEEIAKKIRAVLEQ